MTTLHNHKYSTPEEANKLNEMEIEEKSPKLSNSERISKHKTLIGVGVAVAVVTLITVGIIIGVVSNSKG